MNGEITLPEMSFNTGSRSSRRSSCKPSRWTVAGAGVNYVFPAIIAVLRQWVGWLVMGGLLHLMLTMLGGRDNTGGRA